MRAVSAGIEAEAARFEGLKLRIGQAPDGLVDAVELNARALAQGGFGEAHSMAEAGLFRPGGEKQAELFSAQ